MADEALAGGLPVSKLVKDRLRDPALRIAEEDIALGTPYGIAEAGIVGDLNGVLSRLGRLGILLV